MNVPESSRKCGRTEEDPAQGCEFPVADRPNALKKWLASDDSKRGEWILMIETDYVWKKAVPMPPPGSPAVAFHFHYINPKYPSLPEVMKKLMPPEKRDTIKMADIPPTGPAPTIIRGDDLVGGGGGGIEEKHKPSALNAE